MKVPSIKRENRIAVNPLGQRDDRGINEVQTTVRILYEQIRCAIEYGLIHFNQCEVGLRQTSQKLNEIFTACTSSDQISHFVQNCLRQQNTFVSLIQFHTRAMCAISPAEDADDKTGVCDGKQLHRCEPYFFAR